MNYRTQNPPISSFGDRLGIGSTSRVGLSQRKFPANDQNYGEIEFMLENQRKKFRQAKQKYEYDLDCERKVRIQFENKLIKFKDELSRKNISLSEYQFKINNLLHQNQDLSLENQRLNSELVRLESIYTGKIYQLQQTLDAQSLNSKNLAEQYNTQFEKFKKQGQEYIQNLQFDYDRKIKVLQQKLKSAQSSNRDFQMENKKLNDILITNKLTFEQQIRDLKNKYRDEETKKVQSLSKSYEQKLRLIEQTRQTIAKRNADLLKIIQQKDRKISQIEQQRQSQIIQAKQENADFSQKITHLNYLVNKLKSQLSEKQNLIGLSSNGSEKDLHYLRQQLETKKQQISQLNISIKDLRNTIKQNQMQWQRKRRELIQKSAYFQSQARKYKQQYHRICDNLKSRINQTINNVSYKK